MTDIDNQKALTPGTNIAFYELIQELGQGAFGITYLALDTQRNRPVVLKEYFPENSALRSGDQTRVSILSANKQGDFEEGLRRFRREAQVLSEFDHPNVVKVIGLFDANDTAYFVMEYIDGQSLQRLLKERRTPFAEADIQRDLLPILNGLQAVHDKGFLHLDIKPDNILTSRFGQPLLIDFGGARYATSQASQDHSSMVATLGYAPPEQYTLGKEQTPATDLYAFGMTLYHLMAPDQSLPDARSRQDALLEEAPDPLPNIRDISQGYSEALYQLVELCTQVRRNRRPQSVEEVKALLPKQKPAPQPPVDRTPPEPDHAPPEPAREMITPKPEPGLSHGPIEKPVFGHDGNKRIFWWAMVAGLVVGVLLWALPSYEDEPKSLVINDKEHLAQLEIERKQLEQQRILKLIGDLVRIPSGSFHMGSNGGKANEKPVHKVNIRGFYMMEHEVTRAAFEAFVMETARPMSGGCYEYHNKWQNNPDLSWQSPGFQQSSRDPVVCVNWKDATAFEWASQKTGKKFRLPSESEWEYAARAGTTSRYSWGNLIDCSNAQYGGRFNRDCIATVRGTATVKSYSPNSFGLYDMHGNAAEWVQDCSSDSYNGAPKNNQAWQVGYCSNRVVRGGSWDFGPNDVRVSTRFTGPATGRRYYNDGFRLVQEP